MQKIYAIEDGFGDLFQGTWIDKALADKALKIIQMAVDDCAKLVSLEVNDYAEQISAGLLPFKVEIFRVVASGQILDKKISLTWPPAGHEGLVEERDDYLLYFAWAKTQGEAIQKAMQKAVSAKRSGSTQTPKARAATW